MPNLRLLADSVSRMIQWWSHILVCLNFVTALTTNCSWSFITHAVQHLPTVTPKLWLDPVPMPVILVLINSFVNTVVPVMYSPRHEQTPRMCGHVSIYGYFPIEIPCKKQPPAESGRGHPFRVTFPPWRFNLSAHQHQKSIVSFGFTILPEIPVSEISKVNKVTHNAWRRIHEFCEVWILNGKII